MDIGAIFFIVILIFSVVIHEVSHGYVANMLGDPTARLAGRLTLNPIPHIDLVGSILVPFFLIISSTQFLVGWAKPVPVNLYNLKGKRSDFLVSVAGVGENLVVALLLGAVIRFSGLNPLEIIASPFYSILVVVVGLNLVLAIFNLIPIPPLDGSKVLFSMLPYRFQYIQRFMERYWLVLIVVVFLFAGAIIIPILSLSFELITGLPLGVYGGVIGALLGG